MWFLPKFLRKFMKNGENKKTSRVIFVIISRLCWSTSIFLTTQLTSYASSKSESKDRNIVDVINMDILGKTGLVEKIVDPKISRLTLPPLQDKFSGKSFARCHKVTVFFIIRCRLQYHNSTNFYSGVFRIVLNIFPEFLWKNILPMHFLTLSLFGFASLTEQG